MKSETYIGAFDNQTIEEKAKNFKHEEIVAAITPVVWTEKTTLRSFPIRNQDGSSTCVKQTEAKEKSIWFQNKYGVYVEMSASFGYQQRSNLGNLGCGSFDVFDVFPKIGDVYESLMPSQNMSEEQVMAVPRPNYLSDLAKVYNFKRIALPIDFETVASTIQATGKGVMVWFKFSYPEWTDTPQVLPQPTTSGHSVCAVDFTLRNGKKYLVIDDSWGIEYAVKGQRFISEEYFNARCFLAAYLVNFTVQNNDIVAERPHFILGSVSKAKDCLKWEGLFPGNIASNEVADNIFRTALVAYQKRYNIQPTLGNFGPLTNASLLKFYP